MIIPFRSVGVGECFTFSDDTSLWIGYCRKIDAEHYALCTNENIVVHTLLTEKVCIVDNSCACTEPRQLTFDDLSIGDIFQFGCTWYAQADLEHKYVKLCNMYYTNFYSDNKYKVGSTDIVVCTPDMYNPHNSA